jgi:hypothetical protein
MLFIRDCNLAGIQENSNIKEVGMNPQKTGVSRLGSLDTPKGDQLSLSMWIMAPNFSFS